MIHETEIGVRPAARGEVSLDEDGASVPRDGEGVGEEVGQTVGEEVGELADGRTIRFFSWVTPGEET